MPRLWEEYEVEAVSREMDTSVAIVGEVTGHGEKQKLLNLTVHRRETGVVFSNAIFRGKYEQCHK